MEMTRERMVAEWRKRARICRTKAQFSAADAFEACATELDGLRMTEVVCAPNRRSARIKHIADALRANGAPMRMKDLATAVNMKQIDAFAYVRRMISDGTVHKAAPGHYAITNHAGAIA